jgi:putative NADH-flavin reductase
MHLTIFGGTGATGILLVRQTLQAGHLVTAFARNPARLALTHPRLTVVPGQLTDAATIEEAVRDADAVVSVLGPSMVPVAGTPIADGTATIVGAMRTTGVRRFVASATVSVTDPRDVRAPAVRALVTVVRRLTPHAYADVVGTGRAVTNSGLDWTLVRVPLLRNRARTGRVEVGYLRKETGLFLSRANFAHFMLGQVTDTAWIGEAPVIADAR